MGREEAGSGKREVRSADWCQLLISKGKWAWLHLRADSPIVRIRDVELDKSHDISIGEVTW